MARPRVTSALDEDDVHAVDIVLKGRGNARLLRLAEPAEVEAALNLLRQLAERGRESGSGVNEHEEVAPAHAPASTPA